MFQWLFGKKKSQTEKAMLMKMPIDASVIMFREWELADSEIILNKLYHEKLSSKQYDDANKINIIYNKIAERISQNKENK